MEIQERILETMLNTSTPPWFPYLTEHLVTETWRALLNTEFADIRSYSTTKILSHTSDKVAPSPIVAPFALGSFELSIEVLPAETQKEFEHLGLTFANQQEHLSKESSAALKACFELIGENPTLLHSILTLVRCVHFLSSTDGDNDVSFSDPNIPFSIFISMPNEHTPNATARLAESIIHESMHLQLTLIEKFSPLIGRESEILFSPWKNSERDARGVMHAVYVFSVILRAIDSLSSDSSYISKRRREIREQLKIVDHQRLLACFTEIGSTFYSRFVST